MKIAGTDHHSENTEKNVNILESRQTKEEKAHKIEQKKLEAQK